MLTKSESLERYQELACEFHRLMDLPGERDWYEAHVALMDRVWGQMSMREQMLARDYLTMLYERRIANASKVPSTEGAAQR